VHVSASQINNLVIPDFDRVSVFVFKIISQKIINNKIFTLARFRSIAWLRVSVYENFRRAT